jgi:DNA-binding transcriptional regulator YhcF (GntR family)
MHNNTSLSLADNSLVFPGPDELEAKLVDAGATAAQVEEVVWLLDYAKGKRIFSYGKLGQELGCNASTLSKVFRGKYEAGLVNFCEQIAHFKSVVAERQEFGPEIFLPELSVVKRLRRFAEIIRATQQIGIAWGKNQSGKTKALEYIGATTPMTCYHALPVGGGTKLSMKEVALARGGISPRKSNEELRDMLIKRFNKLWLLIADEFHQTMKGRTLRTVTIDRYREIRDRTKCGLLICGTDQIPEMLENEKYKDFLGQIGNRGVLRMFIPTAPTARDIELLEAAYGFGGEPTGDAAKHVRQIANENGIGKLSAYFTVARMLANKKHERLAWKHFLTAHHTLASWAKGEFGEDQKKNGKDPAQ